jgi:endosialidase-like protein
MNSAVQALILLALPLSASAADVVVPIDSVENHVNVRMEADAKSEIVGKLSQGDSLPFQRSVPGWHAVRLEDDAYGYISEDWAVVITAEEFAARQIIAEHAAIDETVAAEESELPDSAEQPVPEADAAEADSIAAGQSDTRATASGDSEPATEPDAPSPVEPIAESAPEASPAASEQQSPETAAAGVDVVTETLEGADDTETAAAQTNAAPPVVVVPAVTGQGASRPVALGPAGPIGPPGPPGPAGASSVKGTQDYLVKFTERTEGGNSQVYDNGRYVGIGTTEPKQRLEVNGNIQIHERNSGVAGLMLTQSTGGMGYIMHNRANALTLGAGSVDRLTIDRDGNVGIGTARPSHPIEMASGAYVSAGGVWTNSSSREKKDNIIALTPEEALAALVALEPVRFNYKQDASEEYVGFIAEDVPALLASSDRSSLSTMDIVAVLTRVVQEQQQKISELEARLDSVSRR